MICNNCGNEVLDDSIFCSNCGNKLVSESTEVDEVILCPKCGFENDKNSSFCTDCGFNLNDDYEEVFTTYKKYSNIVKENRSENMQNKKDAQKESFSSWKNEVLYNNLPDSLLENNKLKNSGNTFLGKMKAKTKSKTNKILEDNLPEEYRDALSNKKNNINQSLEGFVGDTATVVSNIHDYREPIKEQKRAEKAEINRQKWEEKNKIIIARYEELAEREFNLSDEDDYFLTSMQKHSTSETLGRKSTFIDGFLVLKEDKFLFEEIGNREWGKTKTGSLNIYFDQIVSVRVTRSLGDENKYEDITKVVSTSLHDVKQSVHTASHSIKSLRWKEFVTNNDGRGMFDMLIIKMVDRTSYEIRLPDIDIGNNLVQVFETWKNEQRQPKVVVQNQDSIKSKADYIKEYKELLDEGLIDEKEFNQLKNDLINSK